MTFDQQKGGSAESAGFAADTADGRLQARFVPGRGSDLLAIVFSQIRVPAGHFGLSRLFARTSHACLFLNDSAAGFYRGLGSEIDRLADRAIAAARPSRIVYYGASMGGTGALATGLRRDDGAIYAFAPDLTLGRPLARSAGLLLGTTQALDDLGPVLGKPRAHPATLVFGAFDAADAAFAAEALRLANPALQTLLVASGHEVHDHFYSLNLIRRLIGSFTRDLGAECAAKGLLRHDDPAALTTFYRLAVRHAADEVIDLAQTEQPELAGNPGWRQLAADITARTGDSDRAIALLAALDADLAMDPVLSTLPKRYRKRVPKRLIALLTAAGRPQEAQRVAAVARARFPEDAELAALAGAPGGGPSG